VCGKDTPIAVEKVLVQHLMTGGRTVVIVHPDRLRELMWEELEALYDYYGKTQGKPRPAKAEAL
jgi:hypothetical protein